MGPTVKLLRTQTDARLVTLARGGHEPAFEAIVERYRRPLLRAARRVLPASRAEDAVQQAFLAAWRALERGDEVRELRPWLYRIVEHTALNALRVRGYEDARLEEDVRAAGAPQDELERRDAARRALAGLAALPERQRRALVETAIEGRSQAEVAAAMGLTHGAFRQLVHRARHTLRTAATAVTPLPWLAGGPGGGGAALAAKAGVVAVVAGGAVTGGVVLEHEPSPPRAQAAEVRPERTPGAAPDAPARREDVPEATSERRAPAPAPRAATKRAPRRERAVSSPEPGRRRPAPAAAPAPVAAPEHEDDDEERPEHEEAEAEAEAAEDDREEPEPDEDSSGHGSEEVEEPSPDEAEGDSSGPGSGRDETEPADQPELDD